MTFFVISVLLLNLILWVVLLIKFKSLFSTDGIVSKTQKELNNLVKEIDMAADRDTYLARESTKRIQNTIEEAEQKMELFKEATQRLRDMIAEADRLVRNQGVQPQIKNNIDPDAAFELNIKNKNPQQGSLFDDNNSENYNNYRQSTNTFTYPRPKNAGAKPVIQPDEITVTADGAAYKQIPLVITKIYEEKPVENKEQQIQPSIYSKQERKPNLNKQVESMFEEGFSVEQIAAKLNCSITEVQFIIDMQ